MLQIIDSSTWANYLGNDFKGYFVTKKQNDTYILNEANFEAIEKYLTDKGVETETQTVGYFSISVTYLLLPLDASEEDKKIVEEVHDMLNQYPIFDEEIYDEISSKYIFQHWENWGKQEFSDAILEANPEFDLNSLDLWEFYLSFDPYYDEDGDFDFPTKEEILERI